MKFAAELIGNEICPVRPVLVRARSGVQGPSTCAALSRSIVPFSLWLLHDRRPFASTVSRTGATPNARLVARAVDETAMVWVTASEGWSRGAKTMR